VILTNHQCEALMMEGLYDGLEDKYYQDLGGGFFKDFVGLVLPPRGHNSFHL